MGLRFERTTALSDPWWFSLSLWPEIGIVSFSWSSYSPHSPHSLGFLAVFETKPQEISRKWGKKRNSMTIWWYFKFCFSSPIYVLPFIYSSESTVLLCILVTFTVSKWSVLLYVKLCLRLLWSGEAKNGFLWYKKKKCLLNLNYTLKEETFILKYFLKKRKC